MAKLYKGLADYIIRKGMAEESDREMYEYAFEIAAEMGLFAATCIVIALCLQMFWEGILFFALFIPLRSYAGGLHMETFTSCFFMSCLAFSGVLLAARYIEIPGSFLIITLILLELIVYRLYPVENANRAVDEEENAYFKKKLKKFLLLDYAIAVICLISKNDKYLLVVTATFLLIIITMIAGKYKDRFMPDR